MSDFWKLFFIAFGLGMIFAAMLAAAVIIVLV